MVVRVDCRHYSTRTLASGDRLEKCRVDANHDPPFACPDGCLFFERRTGMSTGWIVSDPS